MTSASAVPARTPLRRGVGAVLFDLDGTLVDPAGGITGGVAHALRSLGIHVPSESALGALVGPKLSDGLLAHTDAAPHQVPELIRVYRRWYLDQGIGRSRLYPGITDLLVDLRRAGVRLAVATQKPEPLATVVLAHHGIAGWFDAICGSSADETLQPGDAGYRSGKQEIVAAALAGLGVEDAVMVGDRYQDVAGARANGLPAVGVAWGFAAHGELEAAGATAVVRSTGELLELLADGAL